MADKTDGGADAPVDHNDYIDTKQAASLLGVDEWNLKVRRRAGFSGPPGPPWYRRLGRIFYRTAEVLAFKAQQGTPKPNRPARRPFPTHPSGGSKSTG